MILKLFFIIISSTVEIFNKRKMQSEHFWCQFLAYNHEIRSVTHTPVPKPKRAIIKNTIPQDKARSTTLS
jgi:hypothetical protein